MTKIPTDLLLLLRLFRYRDWVSEIDLEICLTDCEDVTSADPLLDHLVQAGKISAEQASSARSFLRKKTRSLTLSAGERNHLDRSFGQIALDNGWIGESQLELALLEQERLQRLRLDFRIGEVLIRAGSLDVDQVREILRLQGFDLVCCGECDRFFDGSDQACPLTMCPDCGGELEPPSFLDSVLPDPLETV